MELNKLKAEYTDLHTEANKLEKQVQMNRQQLEQYKTNNQTIVSDTERVGNNTLAFPSSDHYQFTCIGNTPMLSG